MIMVLMYVINLTYLTCTLGEGELTLCCGYVIALGQLFYTLFGFCNILLMNIAILSLDV